MSGNQSDSEYNADAVLKGESSYSEAKYLVVTVTNFGSRTIRFQDAQTSAGRAVAIPDAGGVVQSSNGNGNVARLVFKQSDGGLNPKGPDVHITFKGKKGSFKLNAQQNYAVLKAGEITASGEYSGFGTGQVKFTKAEGGYDHGNGLVDFQVMEEF
ncbi:hypothetical protein G9A89_010474 [Geosiphon pyriformis]|nr:hypothetical protein G9A89_010474 [Geosiphon pyriformis]